MDTFSVINPWKFLLCADKKETSPTLIENSTLLYAANMPPGLRKKGKLPQGLQGKTPHGWTVGKKTGWTRVWNAESKRWEWVKSKGKRVREGKPINPGRNLR